MRYAFVDTPLGDLLVVGTAQRLRLISFQSGDDPVRPQPEWQCAPNELTDYLTQLRQYFAGTRRGFGARLALRGTAFQRSVWQQLLRIPYGRTWTYADVARGIGRPKAVRAVGQAIGRNPLPIIVPCHRVIASDGKLAGFSSGIWIKNELLKHERRYADVRSDA